MTVFTGHTLNVIEFSDDFYRGIVGISLNPEVTFNASHFSKFQWRPLSNETAVGKQTDTIANTFDLIST